MSCNHLGGARRFARIVAFAAAIVPLLSSVSALADPIDIPTLAPPGDVASFFVYTEYTLIDDLLDDTGLLSATGDPQQFDVGNQGVSGGLFDLQVILNRADGSVVSGTFNLTGTTDDLVYSGLLLNGHVVDFGFTGPPGGALMQFRVVVDGGALAGPYYSTTGFAGINMTLGTPGSHNFTGVFTAPWANDGINGFTDTYPTVPEPSTLVLAGMSVLGLAAFHLRRRTRRPTTAL